MTTPAGWYPDPSRAPGQRYFDGAQWTEQRTQAPAAAKRTNTIGIVALIASIIGFIFACVPGALVVGWVLLPAAFVLGIVGLFLTGKARGTSIAAVIVSMIGTVVGVVVFFTVVSDAFKESFHKSDLSASSPTPDLSVSSPPSGGE
jgi:Protein of unknown function (DUF2510)